jgi:hypothetical protein
MHSILSSHFLHVFKLNFAYSSLLHTLVECPSHSTTSIIFDDITGYENPLYATASTLLQLCVFFVLRFVSKILDLCSWINKSHISSQSHRRRTNVVLRTYFKLQALNRSRKLQNYWLDGSKHSPNLYFHDFFWSVTLTSYCHSLIF